MASGIRRILPTTKHTLRERLLTNPWSGKPIKTTHDLTSHNASKIVSNYYQKRIQESKYDENRYPTMPSNTNATNTNPISRKK